jgi:hypothetical protein
LAVAAGSTHILKTATQKDDQGVFWMSVSKSALYAVARSLS